MHEIFTRTFAPGAVEPVAAVYEGLGSAALAVGFAFGQNVAGRVEFIGGVIAVGAGVKDRV